MSEKKQVSEEYDVNAVLREAGVPPPSSAPPQGAAKAKKDSKRKGATKSKKVSKQRGSAAPPKATSPKRPSKKEEPPPAAPVADNGFSVVTLKLANIVRDPTLRMRHHLDADAIRDYQQKYEDEKRGNLRQGETSFPPCEVFLLSSGEYFLVNGWHRFEAMLAAGIVEWRFRVRKGTGEEAAQFAATANRTNASVRVTNADKQQIVQNLLTACAHLSDHKLGVLAGVDHKTVGKYRRAADTGKPAVGNDDKKRGTHAKPAAPTGHVSGSGEIPQSTGSAHGKSGTASTNASNGKAVNAGAPHAKPAATGSGMGSADAPLGSSPASVGGASAVTGTAATQGEPLASASGTSEVTKAGTSAPLENEPGVTPVEVTVGVESSWVAVRLRSMSITVRVVEVSERGGVQVARIQVWERLVADSATDSRADLQ